MEDLHLEATQEPNVEDSGEMNEGYAREDSETIKDTNQCDVREVRVVEQLRGKANWLRMEYRSLRMRVYHVRCCVPLVHKIRLTVRAKMRVLTRGGARSLRGELRLLSLLLSAAVQVPSHSLSPRYTV